MASPAGYDEQHSGDGGLPPRVRSVLRTLLALALLGGVYLLAVRGEAILVDLAALGRIFCL